MSGKPPPYQPIQGYYEGQGIFGCFYANYTFILAYIYIYLYFLI